MPESYSLFPYFLENHGIILFLVSLLFVALLDLFDPYSPLKFLIFIHLVCLLFIGHKDYNNQVLIHIADTPISEDLASENKTEAVIA